MTRKNEMVDLVDEIAKLRLKTSELSSVAAELFFKELFSELAVNDANVRDALLVFNRRRADLGLTPLSCEGLCPSDFKRLCKDTIKEWAFLRIIEKY